jgi:hypothetical protein
VRLGLHAGGVEGWARSSWAVALATSGDERLHFTNSDEANQLIASDAIALLIGFALDQHRSV